MSARRRRAALTALSLASVFVALPTSLHAEPPPDHPRPGVVWLIPQLIPSPEWNLHEHRVNFGLRWQVTPFSYSFGVRRGVMPFRFLVVEPLLRHSGSIETYVAPEWLGAASGSGSEAAVRFGLRSYFGLMENGETLSVSIGSSYLQWQGAGSVAYEAGVYTLFGVFGIQAAYDPKRSGGTTTFVLSVRYF